VEEKTLYIGYNEQKEITSYESKKKVKGRGLLSVGVKVVERKSQSQPRQKKALTYPLGKKVQSRLATLSSLRREAETGLSLSSIRGKRQSKKN